MGPSTATQHVWPLICPSLVCPSCSPSARPSTAIGTMPPPRPTKNTSSPSLHHPTSARRPTPTRSANVSLLHTAPADEPPTVRRLKEASRSRLRTCLDLPRRADRDDPIVRLSFHASSPYDIRVANLNKAGARVGWAGQETNVSGTLASMTNAGIRAYGWALHLRRPFEKDHREGAYSRRASTASSASGGRGGGRGKDPGLTMKTEGSAAF